MPTACGVVQTARTRPLRHRCLALWQALKKARRFEVQKLARRQKEAAGDAVAAAKLALQIAAARQVDFAELAHQARSL